jgi:hypothetical protein
LSLGSCFVRVLFILNIHRRQKNNTLLTVPAENGYLFFSNNEGFAFEEKGSFYSNPICFCYENKKCHGLTQNSKRKIGEICVIRGVFMFATGC